MYVAPIWTLFFFFNDTATTEIYTLSLHDALPILRPPGRRVPGPVVHGRGEAVRVARLGQQPLRFGRRSEEHTSEPRLHLVCRLLLETKIISLWSRCLRDLCATISCAHDSVTQC